MKDILTVLALSGCMLVGVPEVIEFVCPILRAGVRHQDQTVLVFSENSRFPENVKLVQKEWAAKKADALLKIEALEEFGASIKVY
jgi:hypothetical protein